MSYTYKYPRPSVTVDCVVFGLVESGLEVLLIRRLKESFEGMWALPGGFVEMDESLEESARRELCEETGLSRLYLEQLQAFGDPGRDPRGRVISIAYYALVNRAEHRVTADTDAADAAWFDVNELPPLAFDHGAILAAARQRLRERVRQAPIGFELLPKKFTLTQLQRLYEKVLERPLDKRNFRKKILSMGLLVDTDDVERDVARRPARLYKFDRRKYRQLTKKGFSFAV